QADSFTSSGNGYVATKEEDAAALQPSPDRVGASEAGRENGSATLAGSRQGGRAGKSEGGPRKVEADFSGRLVIPAPFAWDTVVHGSAPAFQRSCGPRQRGRHAGFRPVV